MVLSPGPMLFIENAPQVYSIYLAILMVAYIVVFIFQVNFIKHIVKILKVKPHHLGVGILVMVIVGSYAIRNSFLDVNVMILMGLIGYFFNRIQLPVTPIVLGMVLGKTIESRISYSNVSYQLVTLQYFLALLLVCLFFALIILNYSAYKLKKRMQDVKKQKQLEGASTNMTSLKAS